MIVESCSFSASNKQPEHFLGMEVDRIGEPLVVKANEGKLRLFVKDNVIHGTVVCLNNEGYPYD